MPLAIFLITLAFLIVLQSAMPFLLKRTIVFGVTIPEEHAMDSSLVSFRRKYSATVLAIGTISLIFLVLWSANASVSENQLVITGLAIQTGLLLLSMALYLFFHAKTTNLKKVNDWNSRFTQIRVADLQSHAKDSILPNFMYVLPMFVTVELIVYTASQYHLLPDQIPTHWGPGGEPDAFSKKTPFSSIALLLMLLVLQAMMLGINAAAKLSGVKLNAGKKKSSQLQQLAFRKYTSWFLLLTTILLTILFGFLQLTTIHGALQNDTLMMALPLGFLVLMLALSAVYAFKVGQGGSRIAVSIEEDETSSIADDDMDDHWKLGVFYVNKQDPSIFVEKRFGIGWSINFGNPIGYLVLFVPIVLILLIAFFV
ncbi:DUF1648 domain-containing protein [Sporosarcina aquimarina]|uniref:DUF5808 domain-containing protein n=1 Tax=Sporosarcina aquimarina TaxID=114975 RepID=A0ABU4FXU1_9BACL|nr:DUF5808 domain-containing protein [Sporosarcina aquimarina]MDW0109542.1 DUF5808 domain-containing protein [Sporosarcina aquimarina]